MSLKAAAILVNFILLAGLATVGLERHEWVQVGLALFVVVEGYAVPLVTAWRRLRRP